MEIDSVYCSNENHYCHHCNFDYNFHYSTNEDCCNYSGRIGQNIGYIVADQTDDDCSELVTMIDCKTNLSDDEERLFHLHAKYCQRRLMEDGWSDANFRDYCDRSKLNKDEDSSICLNNQEFFSLSLSLCLLTMLENILLCSSRFN